ncbi:MAG: NUDIX domain-containing protein [Anaerolineales bacterium]
MATIIIGDRVGKQGQIRAGCSAVVRDEIGRILLTRRTDNGRWCLPGGHVDPGESVAEATAREVLEETGLVIRLGRLIGVYSSPNYLVVYKDGNKAQFVSTCMAGEVIGGEMGLSNETTEVGFFAPSELAGMDIMETHVIRIEDALKGQEAAFVR